MPDAGRSHDAGVRASPDGSAAAPGRPRIRLPRSKLFVPANRPERMLKAMALDADALSLDLEDAVPAAAKASARAALATFLRENRPAQQVWVRVNGRDSGALVADVLALADLDVDVVNVPKAESARDVHLVESLIEHLGAIGRCAGAFAIVPTIETAAGLRCAHEIASASPRVVALQLGAGDLRKSTGIAPSVDALRTVRVMLSLAAAEAGVHALDSAYTDIASPAGFRADATDARTLGFRGKSCIHPSQIADANRIFAPTADEIDEARAVVEAFDEALSRGIGAIQVRGKLVDGPIVDEARRVLALADEGKRNR
ncbi:MAG: CoA ester lyase [Lautropia sp.]